MYPSCGCAWNIAVIVTDQARMTAIITSKRTDKQVVFAKSSKGRVLLHARFRRDAGYGWQRGDVVSFVMGQQLDTIVAIDVCFERRQEVLIDNTASGHKLSRRYEEKKKPTTQPQQHPSLRLCCVGTIYNVTPTNGDIVFKNTANHYAFSDTQVFIASDFPDVARALVNQAPHAVKSSKEEFNTLARGDVVVAVFEQLPPTTAFRVLAVSRMNDSRRTATPPNSASSTAVTQLNGPTLSVHRAALTRTDLHM
jgi:hypothetical protein